jgi:hypothetical protein
MSLEAEAGERYDQTCGLYESIEERRDTTDGRWRLRSADTRSRLGKERLLLAKAQQKDEKAALSAVTSKSEVWLGHGPAGTSAFATAKRPEGTAATKNVHQITSVTGTMQLTNPGVGGREKEVGAQGVHLTPPGLFLHTSIPCIWSILSADPLEPHG